MQISRKSLSAIGVVMSLIIILSQFSGVISNAENHSTTPSLIRVETTNVMKTLAMFGCINVVQQFTSLETWTNGTKVCLADHVINFTNPICGVWVNCTTWLNSAAASTTIKSAPTTTIVQPSVFRAYSESALYSNTATTPDTDFLMFLLKGSNGTCFVSYDHDNNYDQRGYYPGGWNEDYYLNGMWKVHIHFPQKLLSDWIQGNQTAMLLVVAKMLLGKIVKSTLQNFFYAICEAFAAFFDSPYYVAVMAVPAFIDFINLMYQVYGYAAQIFWIRNVVLESFSGDGWAWREKTIYSSDYKMSRPAPRHGSDNYDDYWAKCWQILDCYDVRYWYQTWGADGVFGTPMFYQINWWDHLEVHMVNANPR